MHGQHPRVVALRHVPARRLDRVEHAAEAFQQPLGLDGRLDVAAAALEQFRAEIRFEFADLVADGRRGQMQFVCGQREALQPCGRLERAQQDEARDLSHRARPGWPAVMNRARASMSNPRLSVPAARPKIAEAGPPDVYAVAARTSPDAMPPREAGVFPFPCREESRCPRS